MLPWLNLLEQQLDDKVIDYHAIGGGDFADAFQARLQSGKQVFVKTHHQALPEFFLTEATGLTWLRETNTVVVPEVLAVADDPPLLALQWIEPGSAQRHTEADLGRALAALHQHSTTCFGRPDQRQTGSLGLPNHHCQSWAEFYATQRLLPLAKLAQERQALPERSIRLLESVAVHLDELGGPLEAPALLHGDLWAGNRLVDAHGRSWLIDAAAHYGHREFDLAMMRLFGGYADNCFAAYQETTPLAQGYQERIALHQLAPLVVHAIKFGGHYVSATANALRHYS